MLDLRRVIGVKPLPTWAIAVLGALAGLLAVGLLAALSPLWAMLVIVASVLGLLALSTPHAGLYLLTIAMIAQWPGQLMKFAGVAVAGSALLWALATRRSLVPKDLLLLILALLSGLIGISALVEGGGPVVIAGSESALRFALSYASNLALYWMVSTLSVNVRVVERLTLAMVLAGVAIALIGFAQYRLRFIWIASEGSLQANNSILAGRDIVDEVLSWKGFYRIDSLTGAADYLGLTMQILIPFAFFWTIRQASGVRRIAGLLALAAMATAMVLSFTRGIFVTTAVIVVPMLAHRYGWRRAFPFLVAGVVLALVTVLSWTALRERIASTATELLSGRVDNAGGWRRAIIPIALQIIFDHFLFGAGVAQHKELWAKYAPSDLMYPGAYQEPLHNSYLLLAMEIGFMGPLLLIALMLLGWRRLRKLQRYFRASGQRSLFDIALAAEITWIAMACNMLLYPIVDATFRYFWVLLALIGALSRVRLDQDDAARNTALAARRSPRRP
ncbi:MAG TPA: O-antigen ligase family protein [Roseiflexaceae bacterium]|nr:O-antigen ligase family protein [Roseiflexaceae bacterium]